MQCDPTLASQYRKDVMLRRFSLSFWTIVVRMRRRGFHVETRNVPGLTCRTPRCPLVVGSYTTRQWLLLMQTCCPGSNVCCFDLAGTNLSVTFLAPSSIGLISTIVAVLLKNATDFSEVRSLSTISPISDGKRGLCCLLTC